MKKSNCFFFAFWKFLTQGGYWAVRKSRHIWGWHWLWSPDLITWYHYSPLKPKKLPCALWDKFWYKGEIKVGDKPDNVEY
jgi:hypothetical protein